MSETAPQRLLVLGGTSDIALATVRELIKRGSQRIVLAGRPGARLERAAAELRSMASVRTLAFDAADPDTHVEALREVFRHEEIDAVLVAFGVLGRGVEDEGDVLGAVEVGRVTYVGAVSAALVCAQALREQGRGSLVILSSVAGQRVRRANFVYGSAKAGLDSFASGLTDWLHGSGVHVMVVRPGFVDTKLTAGMPKAPMSTTAQGVARAIADGLGRRTGVVWVPRRLRYVMAAVRLLPRPVFRWISQ